MKPPEKKFHFLLGGDTGAINVGVSDNLCDMALAYLDLQPRPIIEAPALLDRIDELEAQVEIARPLINYGAGVFNDRNFTDRHNVGTKFSAAAKALEAKHG